MKKLFKIVKNNFAQIMTFIFLIMIPAVFWGRVLYVLDNGRGDEISGLEGLGMLIGAAVNFMFVPIETMTIAIFNVLGFCILKRHKPWKIAALAYLSAAAFVFLAVLLFNARVQFDGETLAETLLSKGLYHLRDIFYICMNCILSCVISWIITLSDMLDKRRIQRTHDCERFNEMLNKGDTNF